MPTSILFAEVLNSVARHDDVALQHFLQQDPKIANQCDKRQKTPLYFAAQERIGGGTKCTQILLESKADPNAAARSGKTPLICACESGNVGTFTQLVKAGANFNVHDRDGHTPMHAAAQYGHRLLVKKLLELSAEINCRSKAKWTPLHFAAKNSHFSVVVMLVQFDANVCCETDSGETAVNIAHRNGNRDIVEYLMPKAKGHLKFYGSRTVARSLDSVMLGSLPDQTMRPLSVVAKLRDVPVPTDPRYHVHVKRSLVDVSASELSGLLAVNNLPFLSGPFMSEGIDGAALVEMQPEDFATLYPKVAASYHRLLGKHIAEDQYNAVMWRQLRTLVKTMEKAGVDEDVLARCLALHSLREMEDFEDVFRALDHDGSDSLSIAELLPALDQLGHLDRSCNMSGNDLRRAFRAADRNGDRRLSLEEFKSLYNKLTAAHISRTVKPSRNPVHSRSSSLDGGALLAGGGAAASASGTSGTRTRRAGGHHGHSIEHEHKEHRDRGGQKKLHRDGSFGSYMANRVISSALKTVNGDAVHSTSRDNNNNNNNNNNNSNNNNNNSSSSSATTTRRGGSERTASDYSVVARPEQGQGGQGPAKVNNAVLPLLQRRTVFVKRPNYRRRTNSRDSDGSAPQQQQKQQQQQQQSKKKSLRGKKPRVKGGRKSRKQQRKPQTTRIRG